jgi:hypothetical protein
VTLDDQPDVRRHPAQAAVLHDHRLTTFQPGNRTSTSSISDLGQDARPDASQSVMSREVSPGPDHVHPEGGILTGALQPSLATFRHNVLPQSELAVALIK